MDSRSCGIPARFQKSGEATFNYPYSNPTIGHDEREIAVTLPRNVGHASAKSPVTMARNTQFESEIDLNLGAGFAAPTAEEACNAAAHLAKAGKQVSGAAVGRLVGARDAYAAQRYIPKKASLGDDDFATGISALDAEISRLPPRREARLILQRDKVILRLIRLTSWPIKQVLNMTVKDAVKLSVTPANERQWPSEVGGLLMCYLRDTRRYLQGDDSGNSLFIGWKTGGIGKTAWHVKRRRFLRSISSTLALTTEIAKGYGGRVPQQEDERR
jgi:hypothetical protein